MAQDLFDTIDPNTTSGTQLAAIVTNFKDAFISNQSGAARPPEIDPGGTWLQIVSATQWQFFLYDGTDDILIYTVNPTANTVTFPGTTNTFTLTRQSADSIGPILEFLKLRDSGATLQGDELGSVEFKGSDGTTSYTQARIKVLSLDDTSASEQGADIIIETTSQDANSLIEALRITGAGAIGIGVNAPQKKLHVRGTTLLAGLKIERDQNVVDSVELELKKKQAAVDNGQTKNGNGIGKHVFKGTDENGDEIVVAEIEVSATQDHTTANNGSKLVFRTKSNDSNVFTENIVIENGQVTINGQVQDDVRASLDLEDTTATRNLFSIDSTVYKAFTAKVHIEGKDTVGPNQFAQVLDIEGVFNGTDWNFTDDSRTLNDSGLLVELSYTNGATLVVDYVNQIANADFDTGKIYLDIVRKN